MNFAKLFNFISKDDSSTTAGQIIDLRESMPNYTQYKNNQNTRDIEGIAIHHSATVNPWTGSPTGNAKSFFDYHVKTLRWTHGGYNYVIDKEGIIEYALDEKITPFHAGFRDPKNSLNLEFGQYWNNHYIAICLSGSFSKNRQSNTRKFARKTPNFFTQPSQKQLNSLLYLISILRDKYNIPIDNIRGHRELNGCDTICPGENFDLHNLRKIVQLHEDRASSS